MTDTIIICLCALSFICIAVCIVVLMSANKKQNKRIDEMEEMLIRLNDAVSSVIKGRADADAQLENRLSMMKQETVSAIKDFCPYFRIPFQGLKAMFSKETIKDCHSLPNL